MTFIKIQYEKLNTLLRFRKLFVKVVKQKNFSKDIRNLQKKVKTLKRKIFCNRSAYYNHDILTDVFKFLELSEIAKSQLVSHGWNNTVKGKKF